MNAAFQIICGGVIPLDITTVQTGDGGKCYMSLLANWGLAADVDIESEKFRKIGETRFILGMVCEWLRFGKGSLGNQADFDSLLFTVC